MSSSNQHPEQFLDGSIDAGLWLLERVIPRGVILTQDEIAYVCGCSRGYIWLLEKSAKEKLRRVIARRYPFLEEQMTKHE